VCVCKDNAFGKFLFRSSFLVLSLFLFGCVSLFLFLSLSLSAYSTAPGTTRGLKSLMYSRDLKPIHYED